MDQLEQELAALPHRLRVALAALSAERMLPVYKYTTQSDVIRRGPSLAVNTAWAFAEGENISDSRLAEVRAELDKAFPEPELGGGADHFACSTAAYALDAIRDETPQSAWRAVKYGPYTLSQIDEAGEKEEEAWQQRAIELTQRWGDRPVRRAMYDPLRKDKPDWLTRLET